MITLDSLLQQDLARLNHAVTASIGEERSNESDIQMKNHLENQTRAYYASAFLGAMMLKRHHQSRMLFDNADTSLSAYEPQWEKITEAFLLTTAQRLSPMANAAEFHDLVSLMVYTLSDYRKYDFERPATSEDQEVYNHLLAPIHPILDTTGFVNDKALFAYRLNTLNRFINNPGYYSPTLLDAVNYLKKRYPYSEHWLRYSTQIARLEKHVGNGPANYEKVQIMDENYTSIEVLLENFRGQNILLDVWAMWCPPCMEALDYRMVLAPFIERDELTVLYLSLDKQRSKKRWKAFVNTTASRLSCPR